MHLTVRPLAIGGAALALLACGVEPAAPAFDARHAGLALRLDIQPAAIAPGDSFFVRLVLRNVGLQPADLVSGCSIPSFFTFTGPAGEVGPAPGYGCYTVITKFTIASGDSLVQAHRMFARDAMQHGEPPFESGTYRVETAWNIQHLPVLRRQLTVLEGPAPQTH